MGESYIFNLEKKQLQKAYIVYIYTIYSIYSMMLFKYMCVYIYKI